jgi:predicted nicotinamide N-methyase
MNDLMKLQKRKIKITENKHIYLSEQTLFKADGGEGLHLWESAIVFSRYINKYPEIYENKKVIELGRIITYMRKWMRIIGCSMLNVY